MSALISFIAATTLIMTSFVILNASLGILTSISHWISALLSGFLTLTVSLGSMNTRLGKRLKKSQDINSNVIQIKKGQKVISSNFLSKKLNLFLLSLNKEHKHEVFIERTQIKLNKLNKKDLTKKSIIKRIELLEKNLNKTIEEVWAKENLKVYEVNYGKLFRRGLMVSHLEIMNMMSMLLPVNL